MTWRLTPKAQADLDAIYNFTVGRWNIAQAEHYAVSIHQAFDVLSANPNAGRAIDQVLAGVRRTSVGSHYIFYRVERHGVTIVRLLHHRMDATRHLQTP